MDTSDLKRKFINPALIGVELEFRGDHLQLRGIVSGLGRIVGALRQLAETAMLRHRPCPRGIKNASCLFEAKSDIHLVTEIVYNNLNPCLNYFDRAFQARAPAGAA
jgi:hypothetical protein